MRILSVVLDKALEIIPKDSSIHEWVLSIRTQSQLCAPEVTNSLWNQFNAEVLSELEDLEIDQLTDWHLQMAKLLTNCEDMDDAVWKQQVKLPRNPEGDVVRP